ncbi:hypothetical protein BU24DRAFT_266561 [Aaosphaeria arxii CBS 175.79]|uniref:Uncharacterized protein n=1 Tax=Aaosphaeria arxii CBS 175.79 TaxID=1450172 RepID=A0A6A5XGE3_9PLEO|nr:uncharacterized protein BU24DRAFT_266561 [Aaosphaeria arxii CBS 175.79]KAF2011926.1 hypothetical protein BU24DRAFT_266561 [Aaosphaeria arxii CBS 175.79]
MDSVAYGVSNNSPTIMKGPTGLKKDIKHVHWGDLAWLCLLFLFGMPTTRVVWPSLSSRGSLRCDLSISLVLESLYLHILIFPCSRLWLVQKRQALPCKYFEGWGQSFAGYPTITK